MGLTRRATEPRPDEHGLIGYQLRNTVTTDDPVTRGICKVDERGYLVALTERRQVVWHDDGQSFTSGNGVQPVTLDGESPTSVNLWGFQPAMWEVLESAMKASGLDEESVLASVTAGGQVPKAEVLLPEVVATMVADGDGLPVRVINAEAKLLGVTHMADLPVVSAELSRQVAWGTRPSRLWGDSRLVRPVD